MHRFVSTLLLWKWHIVSLLNAVSVYRFYTARNGLPAHHTIAAGSAYSKWNPTAIKESVQCIEACVWLMCTSSSSKASNRRRRRSFSIEYCGRCRRRCRRLGSQSTYLNQCISSSTAFYVKGNRCRWICTQSDETDSSNYRLDTKRSRENTFSITTSLFRT